MEFFERIYDLYILLGDPSQPCLWEWETWQKASRAIDPLIEAARGPAAVRVIQERLKDGQFEIDEDLDWDEASHMRWVHRRPENGTGRMGWNFLTLEVWSPGWVQCKSDDRTPDLYIGFRNERIFSSTPSFSPYLALALAADLPQEVLAQARDSAVSLADLLKAQVRAYSRRPWGYEWGGGAGYTDGIGDLMTVGAYDPEEAHKGPARIEVLKGEWEAF